MIMYGGSVSRFGTELISDFLDCLRFKCVMNVSRLLFSLFRCIAIFFISTHIRRKKLINIWFILHQLAKFKVLNYVILSITNVTGISLFCRDRRWKVKIAREFDGRKAGGREKVGDSGDFYEHEVEIDYVTQMENESEIIIGRVLSIHYNVNKSFGNLTAEGLKESKNLGKKEHAVIMRSYS